MRLQSVRKMLEGGSIRIRASKGPAMLGGEAHLMSALKVPRVESYLSRWDACFTPPVPNRCMFSMQLAFGSLNLCCQQPQHSSTISGNTAVTHQSR